MKGVFTIPILLMVSASYAQNGKLKIGIKGGPNFSNLAFSDAPHKYTGSYPVTTFGQTPSSLTAPPSNEPIFYSSYYDYKTNIIKDIRLGLNIGIYAEWSFSERISFVGGVFYEQKGIHLHNSNTEVVSNNSTTSATTSYFNRIVNNDYIILPASVKKYLGKNKCYYATIGIYRYCCAITN